MARMLLSSLSIGTNRSSVGMSVTFFQLSSAFANFANTGSGVRPPGSASRHEPRASKALSTMKPTSPATASAISSTLSYSHHSASIIGCSLSAAPMPERA